jgi:hypothetical protein
MKVVVIGGSRLIDKKLVPILRQQGCEVVSKPEAQDKLLALYDDAINGLHGSGSQRSADGQHGWLSGQWRAADGSGELQRTRPFWRRREETGYTLLELDVALTSRL